MHESYDNFFLREGKIFLTHYGRASLILNMSGITTRIAKSCGHPALMRWHAFLLTSLSSLLKGGAYDLG